MMFHKARLPMSVLGYDSREPIGFVPPPARHRRKWERIVSAFFADDLGELRSRQRTGSRGRILAVLAERCFDVLGLRYRKEPLFEHAPPARWYVDFARLSGIKLRMDSRYNPDYLLDGGRWIEVTLSQNSAYKRLFRYGHQAPRLLVLWLDTDDGLHRRLCETVRFPNATVRSIEHYSSRLQRTPKGQRVAESLQRLKQLRGELL